MKKILMAALLGLSAAAGPDATMPQAEAGQSAAANATYEVRYKVGSNPRVYSAGRYANEAHARRRMHQINENPNYRAWVQPHYRQ